MPMDRFDPGTDQGVGLKLVDRSAESGPGSSRPAPRRSEASRRSKARSLPLWLFVVVVAVAAILLGWQAKRSGELRGQVATLEAQVQLTNAQLEAHRTHLSKIRSGFEDLSASLAGLREMVESDPTEALDAPLADPTPPTR